MLDSEEKWLIPERFRASLDANDAEAHALLQRCDEEQKELAEKIQAPFLSNTPQERQRAKAYITIESLLTCQKFQPLTDDQIEQLAESYAAIGRYDYAAETTLQHRDLYRKYWEAIFKPDASWCSHADIHKYTSENIFSLKHGKEMPMLACNICGHWNCADEPDAIKSARAKRAKVRSETSGMSLSDAKGHMNANYKSK